MLRVTLSLLMVLSLTASTLAAAELNWEIETIDGEGDAGIQIGMALDAFDTPHILYLERDTYALRYATKTGPVWTVQPTGRSGDYRFGTTVIITPEGLPAFSRSGVYSIRSGSGWTSEDMGGFSPWHSTVALAPDGSVYGMTQWSWGTGIYSGFVDFVWRVAADDWGYERIGGAPFIPSYPTSSMTVDSSGHPHFAITVSEGEALMYYVKTITGWSADMLIPGTWSSIAVDADDRPRISFYDPTADDLVLAVLFDAGWLPIRLDQAGDVGLYTSQQLRDGTSHISYYDRSVGDLKYTAYSLTAGATGMSVDTAGDVGQYTAIALDALGDPHIAYYDATNGALKYAVGRHASVPTDKATLGRVKSIFR